MHIKPAKRVPKVGDKVVIKDSSYEELRIDGTTAAKLARLPHCTISDVCECPMGSGGDYYMSYTISIKECVDMSGRDYIFGIEDIEFIN